MDMIKYHYVLTGAPPQITKAPENLTKVESSDARFYCQVTGAPAPNITWTKGLSSILDVHLCMNNSMFT